MTAKGTRIRYCLRGHDKDLPGGRDRFGACTACQRLRTAANSEVAKSQQWAEMREARRKERRAKFSRPKRIEIDTEVSAIIRRQLQIADEMDIASAAVAAELRAEMSRLTKRKDALEAT